MSVSAPTSIALGGLRTAERQFTDAAARIAGTGGGASDSSGGGAQAAPSTSANTPAPGVTYATPASGSPAHDLAASGFDLTGEMVDLLTAKISYSASAAVMKAADAMQKTTIDIVG